MILLWGRIVLLPLGKLVVTWNDRSWWQIMKSLNITKLAVIQSSIEKLTIYLLRCLNNAFTYTEKKSRKSGLHFFGLNWKELSFKTFREFFCQKPFKEEIPWRCEALANVLYTRSSSILRYMGVSWVIVNCQVELKLTWASYHTIERFHVTSSMLSSNMAACYSNGNQYSLMQASFYIIVHNSICLNFIICVSSAWWSHVLMVQVTALDIQVSLRNPMAFVLQQAAMLEDSMTISENAL